MEQIKRIMRPTDIPDTGLLCDLLKDPDGYCGVGRTTWRVLYLWRRRRGLVPQGAMTDPIPCASGSRGWIRVLREASARTILALLITGEFDNAGA